MVTVSGRFAVAPPGIIKYGTHYTIDRKREGLSMILQALFKKHLELAKSSLKLPDL